MTPIESFRLTVFRIAAERLSFTHAAETLHISQPAVTSHIKALEEDLGARLFDRGSGGVRLTPAGERLQAFALDVSRLAQDSLREIGRLNGEQRGRLCLGASTTIAQYLLPRILAEFVQLHPRIDLSVVSANTEKIVAQALDRKVHLGLIEGPPGTSDLKIEPFIEDEIVVIAAADHPLTGRDTDAPPVLDLAAEPLLMREPGSGTRRVVETCLRQAGLNVRDLRIIMELDSTEAIKSGVEAGLGIGFVSRWALRDEQSHSIRIVNVRGLKITRLFQFVYPHGPESDDIGSVFLRLARQFRTRFQTPSEKGP